MRPLKPRPEVSRPEGGPALPDVHHLVPLRVLRAARAIPVAREAGRGGVTLVVAMAEPGDLRAIDELAFAAGMRIRPVQADEREVLRALGLAPEGSGPALEAIDIGPAEDGPDPAGWVVPVADGG